MEDLGKLIIQEDVKVQPKEASRSVIVTYSTPEELRSLESALGESREVIGFSTGPKGGIVVNIEAPTQEEAEAKVRQILGVREGVEEKKFGPSPQEAVALRKEFHALMQEKGIALNTPEWKAAEEEFYREHGFGIWWRRLKGAGRKEGEKKMEERKKIFLPIEISILEQGDKEDEYFELAKHSSVRSEGHLVVAVRRAIRAAMEQLDKPFDAVDIIFRRVAIAEKKRHKAERELLALFHQYEDGTVGTDHIGKKAEAAAKLGVRLEEVKKHIEDEDIRKTLDEAIKIAAAGARVDEFLGQRVILELMGGGRHFGTISKGPWGTQSYQIKTDKGTFKFSVNDVERILAKTGGAQE